MLLMGIVITNAHKNSNVYNMVIPRRAILYHYFNELIRDKFVIYSRRYNDFKVSDKKSDESPSKFSDPSIAWM